MQGTAYVPSRGRMSDEERAPANPDRVPSSAVSTVGNAVLGVPTAKRQFGVCGKIGPSRSDFPEGTPGTAFPTPGFFHDNDGGDLKLVLLLWSGQSSGLVGGVMTPPYRCISRKPQENPAVYC